MSFDNSNAPEAGQGGSSIMPAGKDGVPNCHLSKVEKTKSEDGQDTYLDFVFTDENGKELRERIFEPKDQSANPPYDGYDFKKNMDAVTGRIRHIMAGYVSEDTAKLTKGENWDSYAGNVITNMGSNYSNVETTLKVVFNYNKKEQKEFSGFPKFGSFVSTVIRPITFQYEPKYDFFEKGVNPRTIKRQQGGLYEGNIPSPDSPADSTGSNPGGEI